MPSGVTLLLESKQITISQGNICISSNSHFLPKDLILEGGCVSSDILKMV